MNFITCFPYLCLVLVFMRIVLVLFTTGVKAASSNAISASILWPSSPSPVVSLSIIEDFKMCMLIKKICYESRNEIQIFRISLW